jgi:hypothetical protein
MAVPSKHPRKHTKYPIGTLLNIELWCQRSSLQVYLNFFQHISCPHKLILIKLHKYLKSKK